MIKHNVLQNSLPWLYLRSGRVTASEMTALLTPKKYEWRSEEQIAKYVARKATERWLGGPIDVGNDDGDEREQGKIKEETAIPWYAFRYEVELERVGFITTDNGTLGCSPDAMFKGTNHGIEIKCPKPETQVRYLLADVVPDDYMLQLQTSMLVCGADHWTFFSFHPSMPKFVKVVERNRALCEIIAESVEKITARLDTAFNYLRSLGTPPVPRSHVDIEPERTGDTLDIAGQGITL